MADESPPEEEPTDGSETDEASTDAPASESAEPAEPQASETQEDVKTPEFPNLNPSSAPVGPAGEMNRLYDVQVTVAAELGRTSVPIQKLLGLTEGSVFELDRSISSPVELVAQGIPLGNGEVVVVDDSFAIRIKEIYATPS